MQVKRRLFDSSQRRSQAFNQSRGTGSPPRRQHIDSNRTVTPSQSIVQNAMLMRSELLKSLMGDKRDINHECGYPDNISITDYLMFYKREGVATRVVRVFVDEAWAMDPFIFEQEDQEETEWEKAWTELATKMNLLHYLERIDELSGIGRYGVLLMGFDDALTLDKIVPGLNEKGEATGEGKAERKLLFLRAFDESNVEVESWQTDPQNPRFGLPQTYRITLADLNEMGSTQGTSGPIQRQQTVHWSRVLHVADNRTTSEVFGTPRMEKVFNRLYDLRKLFGGSAEMFWKGGFPGFSFSVDPEYASEVEIDKDALRTEMENYMNGLQRYLALIGISANSLSPQVADPRSHIEVQLEVISLILGVPVRVFFGSEEAKLASSQDVRTWNKRVSRRQEKYVTPQIIRPFIDRLMAVGVLPTVETYQVEWPDLNTPSENDQATVAGLVVDAIAKYIQSGADVLVPPLEFLTVVLKWDLDVAEAVLEAAMERIEETANDPEALQVGKDPTPPPPELGPDGKPLDPAANSPDAPPLSQGAQ